MKEKLYELYKHGGAFAILKKTFNVLNRVSENLIKNIYFKITPSGTFYFNGNKLKYFWHNHNLAYQNERKVEIPIAMWFLYSQEKGTKVLEVGNVLRNYGFRDRRDILDKYDSSPCVINQDVVDFSPKEKYDAIISVSTLEHVGWDEENRDPEKIPRAIKNLKENCLLPRGTMLVTLPLGYNTYFDDYIKSGGDIFTEKYFLKRVSAENEWKQVEYSEVADSKFGEPFNNANAMFIGVIRA